MFQKIDGHFGFVIDLKKIPELPVSDGGIEALTDYAKALTKAIETQQIAQPGKYLVETNGTDYAVYRIESDKRYLFREWHNYNER